MNSHIWKQLKSRRLSLVNEETDLILSQDSIEDPPKEAIDEEQATEIDTIEEAIFSELIISNFEQRYPETIETQKIGTVNEHTNFKVSQNIFEDPPMKVIDKEQNKKKKLLK